MNNFIRIHSSDNVAVALKTVPAGTPVDLDGYAVTAAEEIPAASRLYSTINSKEK